MQRQGLIPYLTAICFCTVFPIFAGEPQGQFWIIRAANEIAVPLVEAVEGKKFPTAELPSRITGWIDAKKIQQLARFDQMLGEEMFTRRNLTGEMRYPDSDEKIELAVIVRKPSKPS